MSCHVKPLISVFLDSTLPPPPQKKNASVVPLTTTPTPTHSTTPIPNPTYYKCVVRFEPGVKADVVTQDIVRFVAFPVNNLLGWVLVIKGCQPVSNPPRKLM